ncbi:Nitroreductase family protein [Paraliobacillus sp. PM-2]|uniref:nitroreductase family protein n=1 Tax=Paraliobacillus sp. PM-2 TaxID=1462524 RepID=UPI00061C8978|nr:nitroreductase family protein [Paraliobacillus sp. PM-2]CQR46083.1 Nitroreductase family protein [Paraliobacillus sp. PM-2]
MSKDFYTAVKNRRSIYTIGKEKVVTEERIEQVVKQAVKHTPYAFNATSGRVVLLFDEHHDKLWNITKETLRKIVPEADFPATEDRINSFANGYGTVLFFEDQEVIEGLQKQMELYKDNFPIWSEQASGMLQFVIWTSLELEGLGVSLQHYNPLIDKGVKEKWGIPNTWKMRAQMPFGNPTAPPKEKEFSSVEERMKVFK